MLYFQSFKDTSWTGDKYFDTGDASVAHDLVNNDGEVAVNVTGMSAMCTPFTPANVGRLSHAGLTPWQRRWTTDQSSLLDCKLEVVR